MRRLLCIALLVCAASAINTQERRVKIESVSGNSLHFKASGLKVGQSGVVLATIHEKTIIIASAEISKVEGDSITARVLPFEMITQKYLPTPEASPKAGDTLIFNGFYNRAIAIAPSQESYNAILARGKNVSFSHIDLFAAFLAKDGINDPKPKHLKEFCNAYSIGLVYMLASNGINVLDCQSFEVLEVLPFDKPSLETTAAPFFSRIVAIDTGSLASKLRSKDSKHYFSYYDSLLKEPLARFRRDQN